MIYDLSLLDYYFMIAISTNSTIFYLHYKTSQYYCVKMITKESEYYCCMTGILYLYSKILIPLWQKQVIFSFQRIISQRKRKFKTS